MYTSVYLIYLLDYAELSVSLGQISSPFCTFTILVFFTTLTF